MNERALCRTRNDGPRRLCRSLFCCKAVTIDVGDFVFRLVCLVSPTMNSEIAIGRLKEASSCDAVHQKLDFSFSLTLRLLGSIPA
jgi:hypothetical protein